jgi:hypothetical protein
MNHFFELSNPREIQSIEELLSLNYPKTYYLPGTDQRLPPDVISTEGSMHSTAGIFRGQLLDWPLLPKCYRPPFEMEEPREGIVARFRWYRTTHKFGKFCERAKLQNPTFPDSLSDRMSIAQHFGVHTPLLDWSRSIFAAIYFAIRRTLSHPGFEDILKVYIYHVIDERLLRSGIPDENGIAEFPHSAFIAPFHIDRRIERQRGVFSYHPDPALKPKKLPANVYVLGSDLIINLLKLMEGFGFTGDYFFPDYAGIAESVQEELNL